MPLDLAKLRLENPSLIIFSLNSLLDFKTINTSPPLNNQQIKRNNQHVG